MAEDVRWYGRWIREETQRRIGHLYPQIPIPNGIRANAVAWLWA